MISFHEACIVYWPFQFVLTSLPFIVVYQYITVRHQYFFVRFHLMWNRVDLAQRELDALRKLVGDEDNALVQRASCT